MPSADAILTSLAAIAEQWRNIAIIWHVALGMAALALWRGWRPSCRKAGYLLTVPSLSVSVAAWAGGNPFNGAAFAILSLILLAIGRRLSTGAIQLAPPLFVSLGALLMAFGWVYPHFLQTETWTTYLYAAPLGLLPCPTLATLIGVTLITGQLGSKPWFVTLASAGILYGAMGVFFLGVALDYGLLAGSLILLTQLPATNLPIINAIGE